MTIKNGSAGVGTILSGPYHHVPRLRPSFGIFCVEQAVVYSTLPQEYSTLTFRGEVVADDGGVEERSEVMY